MKVEIAIIGIMAVAGVVLFLPQTISLFPEPPEIIGGINEDVSDFQTGTKEKISKTIEKPVEKLNSGLQELKANSIDLIIPSNKEAPVVSVSEDKKQTQEEVGFYGKLKEDPTKTEPTQPPTIIKSSSKSSSSSSAPASSAPASSEQSPQASSLPFFQTLSLTTKKQADNNVILSYVDTTGKTKSVKVTLRNSEKTLFEGTFFASKFEAFVFDASNAPHFIDMVVDNEEHGIITSSVFNPSGNTDTTINGVFTKP